MKTFFSLGSPIMVLVYSALLIVTLFTVIFFLTHKDETCCYVGDVPKKLKLGRAFPARRFNFVEPMLLEPREDSRLVLRLEWGDFVFVVDPSVEGSEQFAKVVSADRKVTGYMRAIALCQREE